MVLGQGAHNALAPCVGVQRVEPVLGLNLRAKRAGDPLDLIGIIQSRRNRSRDRIVAQALVSQRHLETADDVVKRFVEGIAFDRDGQVIRRGCKTLAQRKVDFVTDQR